MRRKKRDFKKEKKKNAVTSLEIGFVDTILKAFHNCVLQICQNDFSRKRYKNLKYLVTLAIISINRIFLAFSLLQFFLTIPKNLIFIPAE